jgi:hypothetical protein
MSLHMPHNLEYDWEGSAAGDPDSDNHMPRILGITAGRSAAGDLTTVPLFLFFCFVDFNKSAVSAWTLTTQGVTWDLCTLNSLQEEALQREISATEAQLEAIKSRIASLGCTRACRQSSGAS